MLQYYINIYMLSFYNYDSILAFLHVAILLCMPD